MLPNVHQYAQLPLQGAFVSVYPQGKQMNQHWQPLNTAIAYDRLLCVRTLFSFNFVDIKSHFNFPTIISYSKSFIIYTTSY